MRSHHFVSSEDGRIPRVEDILISSPIAGPVWPAEPLRGGRHPQQPAHHGERGHRGVQSEGDHPGHI